MKKHFQKILVSVGRVWLALLLIFTVGLCPAQSNEAPTIKSGEKGHHWGVGMSFLTGYGNFAGSLKDKYTGFIPIGFSVDVYYKNFAFYAGVFAGYGKTKNDTHYDTATWKKGDWYQLNQADIALGYVAYKNSDYKVAPFVGVSFMDFRAGTNFILLPGDDKPSYWDGKTFDKATFYSVGINFDLIGGTRENDNSTLWLLRLKYAYNFSVGGINRNGTEGSMHALSIGITYLFIDPK